MLCNVHKLQMNVSLFASILHSYLFGQPCLFGQYQSMEMTVKRRTSACPNSELLHTAAFKVSTNQRKCDIIVNLLAISWQRPTTNIKPDMVCVKLIEITE